MIKSVDFAGIQLDNYTVRETIMNVEKNMSDHGLHTIEEVNMDTLMLADLDDTVRAALDFVEHTVIAENGILEAVGAGSYQRKHEIEHHDFFYEMMKRIERNHKTVFIIGDVSERTKQVGEYLQRDYSKCEIVGAEALEDCNGATDAMVNEINALNPDVILSILPSPQQERFLMENHEKLSAGLWYGVASRNFEKQGKGILGKIRHVIRTYKLERRLNHYHGDEESVK